MSNFLAISAVTAALQQRIAGGIDAVFSGAKVTTLRPDESVAPENQARVNLFLYQVTPNPARRNEAQPVRRGGGDLLQRPRAVLDLHYLLSFYGVDQVQTLVPQRLLGYVVALLEARPVLTPEFVQGVVDNSEPDSFLRGLDLRGLEPVRVSPVGLDLEGLSKLWFFFKAPYVLSVAYQASVVAIEADGTPGQALPVLRRGLDGVPYARQPALTEAHAAGGRDRPIVAGGALVLRGRGLAGDPAAPGGMRALIGDVALDLADVTDTFATVQLDDPALRAGVRAVRLVGARGLGSNAVAVVLRPRIVPGFTVVPDADSVPTLTLTTAPAVAPGQRVELLLNERDSDEPAAHILPGTLRADGKLEFRLAGVGPAVYLVRVRVDGAESPLTIDDDPNSPTAGRFVDPHLDLSGGGG